MASKKFRLAILARHVVQYHSPLYREIARSPRIDATVLFLDRIGLGPVFDPTMNAVIDWDVPLLEGFPHVFLRNWSPRKQAFMLARINPGLVRRLRRANFDGVLIQGYDTLSNILAMWTARLFGLQIIFRGEAVLRPGRPSARREFFKKRIVGAFLRNADAVLYSCRGNRELFLHYGCSETKLHSFPCAVDNRYFRAHRAELREAGNPLRSELGIDEKSVVALMVGRLDTNKRQQDLIQAAARLQAKGRDVTALFVGDGLEKGRLENLTQSANQRNVRFVGFKNQSQLSAYYDVADVFCLCSEVDQSPKVINEALNFELPIVSSDRPGTIGDSIRDGENALVYPCGDVDALTAGLERLVADPELRHRFGARSYELSDELSLEADVAGLEGAIEGLIAAK